MEGVGLGRKLAWLLMIHSGNSCNIHKSICVTGRALCEVLQTGKTLEGLVGNGENQMCISREAKSQQVLGSLVQLAAGFLPTVGQYLQ